MLWWGTIITENNKIKNKNIFANKKLKNAVL